MADQQAEKKTATGLRPAAGDGEGTGTPFKAKYTTAKPRGARSRKRRPRRLLTSILTAARVWHRMQLKDPAYRRLHGLLP